VKTWFQAFAFQIIPTCTATARLNPLKPQDVKTPDFKEVPTLSVEYVATPDARKIADDSLVGAALFTTLFCTQNTALFCSQNTTLFCSQNTN
jgi:hypothetical protein